MKYVHQLKLFLVCQLVTVRPSGLIIRVVTGDKWASQKSNIIFLSSSFMLHYIFWICVSCIQHCIKFLQCFLRGKQQIIIPFDHCIYVSSLWDIVARHNVHINQNRIWWDVITSEITSGLRKNRQERDFE